MISNSARDGIEPMVSVTLMLFCSTFFFGVLPFLLVLGFLGPRGLALSFAFLQSLHTVRLALVQLAMVLGQCVPG